MTKIFKAREVAKENLIKLKEKVEDLKKKGITPKMVSILVGDDPGSKLYLSLKKKAAEEIGVEFEVVRLVANSTLIRIIEVIKDLNKDRRVHGVMVQLPLPSSFSKEDRVKIINTIDPKKDVDGMREDSLFVAPVVMAVEVALSLGEEYIHNNNYPYKIVVVGGTGFVGRKIVKKLFDYNPRIYRVVSVNSKTGDTKQRTIEADIIISATGIKGLIKVDMVKSGAVLIDVGSPKGDIEKEAYKKASFVSPVPGGIGPLTIYYLLQNLVQTVK